MVTTFSSLLFVPGSRPDRFEKALDSGADLICIDLEDAVAAEDKDAARHDLLERLPQLPRSRVAVRINGLRTRDGLKDLAALSGQDALPALLFVPMSENDEQLRIASAAFDEPPGLVPLVETAAGLAAAREIAAAPGVAALMLGGADLAAELGVELGWTPLLHARQALVLAAAESRVPAVDVPFIGLEDEAGLAEECRRAKEIGFSGKAAIHPKQVAAINEAFRPSDAERAEARDALAAYRAGGQQAIRHNGRMLEAPLVARYERILEREAG